MPHWVEIIPQTGLADKIEKTNAQTPAKRSLVEGVESEGKKKRTRNTILSMRMFKRLVRNKNKQNGICDQPLTP